MKIRACTILTLTAVAALSGCGPSSPNLPLPLPANPDGTTWSFVPAAADAASIVRLEQESINLDEATLKLTAVGIPELGGLAFRLVFDPRAVEIAGTEVSSSWPSPTERVEKLTTRPEGELWAGISHLGRKAMDARAPTVLARIKVRLRGTGTIELGFRPMRNLALSPASPEPLPVTWLGGRFVSAASP